MKNLIRFHVLCSLPVFLLAFTAVERVSANGLYSQTIIVSPDATDRETWIAEDLAERLEEATGWAFVVGTEGPGGAGITLAVDADDPALAGQDSRDAFAVNAGMDEMRIVGRTEMALENGMNWWLRQLGFRWLHASDKWTIVPDLTDLRMDIDTVQAPAFEQRDLFATGGPGRPEMDPDQLAWDRWLEYQRRNLLTARDPDGIRLGGHAGEAFVAKHKDTLRDNPDYLAMVDGVRQDVDTPNVKLNVANPGLQDLWINDRLDRLERRMTQNPANFTVSVDPSDGGGHDESPEGQAIGNGSPSDQVFFLANLTAAAVAAEFPDGFVNLYAYNHHAELPSFPLEPNMIVSIIPYGFQTTGRTPEEFIEAWAEKAPVFGLYDYWEIPDWGHNLPPELGPQDIAERVRLWHEHEVKLYLSETTFSGGTMGPNWYLAARLLWDPEADEDAILDEYYLNAFGEARAPVRAMYDRWAERSIFSEHEIAVSLGDLDEALGMTDDPAISARLVDLGRYLHYVALRYDYERETPGTPERIAAAEDVINYIWRIYDSNMVQVFRIAVLLNTRNKPNLDHLRWDNEMWADMPQLGDADILTLFNEDLGKYEALDFEYETWDGPLVPLEPDLQTYPGIEILSRFGSTATFQFFVPEGRTTVPMDIHVGQTRGPDKFDTVVLRDPAGEVVFTQQVTNELPIGDWEPLVLPTAESGIYTMEVRDRKNSFRIRLPEGLPFVCTKKYTNVDAQDRAYFYVPPGLEQIAIYTPGVQPLDIYDPDGNFVLVPDNEDHQSVFLIDVPEGQDDKVWSFTKFKSWTAIELLNCPNNFAWSPETMMIPESILEP